ncbi:3D domain-containing protein [Desulfonatronum thioautotrophicum]|uniref:3D domain-containing protein n=1 Tax=Desulfonatronum thioautotrophicum TaxID=617001 RepID=UPI00069B6616|nr:3D domain-containing protein [Desulfonatronum thioautotrophicum]
MRYTLPIIFILALLNMHLLLKSNEPVVTSPTLLTKEYRFCMKKDLELLKAQDEIHILKMILRGYRESRISVREETSYKTASLATELATVLNENRTLRQMVDTYRDANTHRLRLTAYTARPEECNDDIENTAIMQSPVPGWTVAVSRDLKGWLGKRVYIEGFGVRLVNDLMNARYANAIDVLVPDVPTAKKIGVRRNILVTLVEPLATDEANLSNELVVMLAKQSSQTEADGQR